ncbi:hypothetical protein GCM10027446_05750 [Angustibacter peucedani]
MIDVRDLEVPPADGAWDTAPDALRSAVVLLVPVAALAALRVWMVGTQWSAFQGAFGRSHGLDMTTDAGWVTAALRTPGQWSSLVDVCAVALLAAMVAGVLRRVSEVRWVAVFVAVGVAVDALASLAYAVPWWYLVATAMLAGWLLLLGVLLGRPSTSMHLMPEPLVLREAWLHGERPARRERR